MLERIVIDPLKTNCYIYSIDKHRCIIIDPGGSEQEIISRLDMLNMRPEGIVFTHGHFDHTAGAGKLRDFYLKKEIELKLAIHENDASYLGSKAKDMNKRDFSALGFALENFSVQVFQTLPEADIKLREGDSVFDSDLKVLETPGHTRGSICLYSEEQGILFSGDTLFFEGIGRADLPGGDEKTLIASIKEKILSLPPETSIYPGHGPSTTVERELKGNPFIN